MKHRTLAAAAAAMLAATTAMAAPSYQSQITIGDNMTGKASLVWKNEADGDPVADTVASPKFLYADLPGQKGCILIIR